MFESKSTTFISFIIFMNITKLFGCEASSSMEIDYDRGPALSLQELTARKIIRERIQYWQEKNLFEGMKKFIAQQEHELELLNNQLMLAIINDRHGPATEKLLHQVKQLIVKGADVNARNIYGDSVLTLATCLKLNQRLIKILVDHGAKGSVDKIPDYLCDEANPPISRDPAPLNDWQRAIVEDDYLDPYH